jgi:hypothetical protein
VEAVQIWLAAAEISAGPVFRAVALGGKVSDDALADDSAARIVKRYARRAGLDPASYAGHSLRSDFLTSAAESGASIWKLSEVWRHKSLDTLRGYVRRVDLFKEHAGATFPVMTRPPGTPGSSDASRARSPPAPSSPTSTNHPTRMGCRSDVYKTGICR